MGAVGGEHIGESRSSARRRTGSRHPSGALAHGSQWCDVCALSRGSRSSAYLLTNLCSTRWVAVIVTVPWLHCRRRGTTWARRSSFRSCSTRALCRAASWVLSSCSTCSWCSSSRRWGERATTRNTGCTATHWAPVFPHSSATSTGLLTSSRRSQPTWPRSCPRRTPSQSIARRVNRSFRLHRCNSSLVAPSRPTSRFRGCCSQTISPNSITGSLVYLSSYNTFHTYVFILHFAH